MLTPDREQPAMTDPKDARIAELEARILELETVTDEDVERAAKAIMSVPSIWARDDVWSSDAVPGRPYQLCMYSQDGKDKIIVIDAFAYESDRQEAWAAIRRKMIARAVLSTRRGDQ